MKAPISGAGGLSPRVAAATDPGRRRKDNEDAFLVRPDLGVFLVADGMGGRNAGEVASSLARASVENFFEATRTGGWPDSYRALLDLTLEPAGRRLSAAIRKANADIHAIASTREAQAKMGTTLVAVHLPKGGTRMYLGHVGDSRCYRMRGDALELLTKDHTMRNEALLQYPHISPGRLARIPASLLSRAVGRDTTVELEVHALTVEAGDVFLLCSDGVNRMLTDEQILEVLRITDDADETVQLLIDFANDAGGRDNITAVTLDFRS